NQALFSLLGTAYGGNGTTTFALPDLRGRTPIHFSGRYPPGSKSGEENHTPITRVMPAPNPIPPPTSPSHPKQPTSSPPRNFWPTSGFATSSANAPGTSMAPQATTSAGGSQAHPNLSPFLVVNFAIALTGVFPSRN